MSYSNKIEEENKRRLQNLVDQTMEIEEPYGWDKTPYPIGGLTEVGFSKQNPALLLVISSQGRGVIDCQNSNLFERTYDTTWDWIDQYEMTAQGIGVLSNEKYL